MKEVILPKFGFTQEDSQIVEWLVEEGQMVEEGDPIVEVTTDKVNMEVEAPASGTLAGFRFEAGDIVPVTEVIAYILGKGETLDDIPKIKPAKATQHVQPVVAPSLQSAPTTIQPQNGKQRSITPVAARMAAAQAVEIEQIKGSGAGGKIVKADILSFLSQQIEHPGKVRATPSARRLARTHNLALADINGSGPNDRIQAIDVENSLQQQTAPDETADNWQPFSPMRRAIANNLQASWQQAPHIMFSSDMDMGNVMRLSTTYEVNITAIITKAVAFVLQQFPTINAHLKGEGVQLFNEVHIGMAVAIEDGLIVPVIRYADQKGINELATNIREVAGRARSGKLRGDDLGGATFSISNLGMYGIDHFTAILNPPEVGILAVGGIRRVFVPDENDQPVVKSLATFTLSVDHRAVDGATAADYMRKLKQVIAQPERMLF